MPQELVSLDIYSFSNKTEEVLFNKITKELRCSVCQNQTLADSTAPFMVDLRREIYKKVRAQEKEQVIVDFVVERYGDFVLYRPPLTFNTVALWFGPFLILCLGLWLVFRQFKKT